MNRGSLLAVLLATVAPGLADAQAPLDPGPRYRFVVLGHIRGDAEGLSPKLAEVLDRAKSLRPAFVVLTGDIIWGDVHSPMARPAIIEREWEQVDSALAALAVPVFRVPGNHDISDLPSRDVWYRRYGSLPHAVALGRTRLLLLSSAWIPADGDSTHNPHVRGVDLDSAQVAWLERRLGETGYDHTFVFMHHLLWWGPDDGRWWREVHPLLARAGVGAVFSGDYGPLKFSHDERDGVRYYQSSIEMPVSVRMLQERISSRVLSAQFDNFLEVEVDGPAMHVKVHTVAETSSSEFTPARHAAINAPLPAARESVFRRVWHLIGSPRRLTGLGVAVIVVFGAGVVVGRRRLA